MARVDVDSKSFVKNDYVPEKSQWKIFFKLDVFFLKLSLYLVICGGAKSEPEPNRSRSWFRKASAVAVINFGTTLYPWTQELVGMTANFFLTSPYLTLTILLIACIMFFNVLFIFYPSRNLFNECFNLVLLTCI